MQHLATAHVSGARSHLGYSVLRAGVDHHRVLGNCMCARAFQLMDTSDRTLGTSISEGIEGVLLFWKYFLPPISLSAGAEAAAP